MQPAPCGVEHERARGFVVDVDLTGVEEQQLAVLLLQDDDRVGQRLEHLAWREVHQQQSAEPAFEQANQSPHAGRIPQ